MKLKKLNSKKIDLHQLQNKIKIKKTNLLWNNKLTINRLIL